LKPVELDAGIVVEVLDRRFKLEDLKIEDFPEEVFEWELGGLTDPIGQLVGWLWSQISGAINSLGSSISSALWGVRDYLYSAITTTIGSVQGAITSIGSTVSSSFSAVSQAVSQAFSTVSTSLSSISGTISSGLSAVSQTITSLMSSVTSTIQSVFQSVSSTLTSISQTIASSMTQVYQGISSLGQTLVQSITGVATTLGNIGQAIAASFAQVITSIGSMAQQLSSSIMGVGQVIQSMASTITSTFSQVQGVLQSIGSQIVSSLTGIVSQVTSAINRIASGISSSFAQVYTYLSSFGSQIMDNLTGFRDWIASGFQVITVGMGQVFDGMKSMMTSFPQWFEDVYGWIMGGINELGSKLGKWWGDVTAYFTDQYGKLTGGVNDVIRTLTGFINPLIGIEGVLKGFASAITGALKPISDAITNAFKNVGESLASGLKPIGDAIGNALKPIGDAIGKALKPIGDAILSGLKPIGDWIAAALKPVGDWIAAALKPVGDWIASALKPIGDWIMTALKPIGDWIASGLKPLGDWITSGLKPLGDWIISGLKPVGDAIAAALKPIGDTIFNALKPIGDWIASGLKPLGDWITSGLKPLGDWIISGLKPLGDWITSGLKPLGDWIISGLKPLGDWVASFDSFIKPLIDVLTPVTEGLKYLIEFITKPLEKVKEFMGYIWGWAEGQATTIFDSTSTLLSGFVTTMGKTSSPAPVTMIVPNWIVGFSDTWLFSHNWFPDIQKVASQGLDWMKKFVGSFYGRYLFAPFVDFSTAISKNLSPYAKKGVKPPLETLDTLGEFVIGAVALPYLLSNILHVLGDNIKFKFGFHLGLKGETDIDIGSIFKHIGRVIWKVPDVIIASLAYGMGIWISQPLAKVLNSFARNELPIQMPDIQEIRSMANRASVSPEIANVFEELRTFMMYYGYSDYMVEWNLGVPTTGTTIPNYLTTTIKNRFGQDVKIPLALRQMFPTGTELCRMMVRDVIIEFDMFAKAMSLQGYFEDVSKMYYLLHYRYPTPENLWTLYRRGMAGMLWYEPQVTTYPEMAANIGFEPKKPAEFNYAEPALKAIIEKYMKWHDYAPFAWQSGWPSDRHVQIDLMADIPMRIDARWLYKWSIIPDGTLDGKTIKSVFNVVRARGIHPIWEEPIAVAECMNALAEERSTARTGVLNVFERGFSNSSLTEKRLDELCKVKLLGKDWPVKNLEGETKLLMLRSLYDRAMNVLRTLWTNLVTGYQRNIFDNIYVMNTVQDTVGKLKSFLGIDITVDQEFLNIWITSLTSKYEMETIQRIRYWMRIFIYRASQLAEDGQAFAGLIDDYAEKAKLTPVEVEIMKALGTAFIDVANKKRKLGIVQKIAKGKVKSGEWTIGQALNELVKAGMDEKEALAFLESEVKVRTVSVDKLISMAERIPIDSTLLKAKMDAEGVPPNEQALYIPYAVASEIEEEQGKLVTEIIDDFIAGKFDEPTLAKNLLDLATLSGTAKTKLGVDWINYSPEERSALIEVAKKRRARRQLDLTKSLVRSKIKSGEWTVKQGLAELVKAGLSEADANTFLETETKTRLVSVDKLVSMAEKIPIDPATLKAKMDAEGVPPNEQALYLPYSIAVDISDEQNKLVTEVIDDFVVGSFDVATLRTQLNAVATLDGKAKTMLGVDWVNISPTEIDILVQIASKRKVRRIAPVEKMKTVSSEKIISLMENIPIDLAKLKSKMDAENIPLDEQALYMADAVASELKEEIGKIATEYVTDYENGLLTDAQFKAALDDLATLGGAVPSIMKIPWIILSPMERQLLLNLAKLKRARKLAPKAKK